MAISPLEPSNVFEPRPYIVRFTKRSAQADLARAGVREQVAMRITGHKTASMYRRYWIVDERDLVGATEMLQEHLAKQPTTGVLVPIKKAASD